MPPRRSQPDKRQFYAIALGSLTETQSQLLIAKDLSYLPTNDFNSIANPRLIFPSSKQLAITGKKINIALDPISVNVVILNYKK